MRTPRSDFVMVALTLSIIAFGMQWFGRHHHSSDPVV